MTSELLVSFRLALAYLRRLLEDLRDEQMLSQPSGTGNHPAWIVGHIVYSLQAMSGELGVQPWLPEDWSRMFGTGTNPEAATAAYPPKSQLLEYLRDAESRVANAIEKLTESDLASPLPDAGYRKTLPTIGHALIHILVGHASVHIGQLTVWRHAMGLPRAPEHFEATAND